MAYMYITAGILFAVFGETFSDLCVSTDYSGYYYTYCSAGCCGSYYYNQYCCSSLEVGTIAGIVIGCIFALAVLVVIIICVCAQCKKKKTGVVISNQPQNTVAFVNTSTQQGGYQQPPSTYPTPNYTYPPAYPPPPPAYLPGAANQAGASDPAYPPPNTAPPAYPGPPPQKY